MAGHLIETDTNGPTNPTSGASSIEISLTGIQTDIGSDRINEMMLGQGGGVNSGAVSETNDTATGGGGGGG